MTTKINPEAKPEALRKKTVKRLAARTVYLAQFLEADQDQTWPLTEDQNVRMAGAYLYASSKGAKVMLEGDLITLRAWLRYFAEHPEKIGSALARKKRKRKVCIAWADDQVKAILEETEAEAEGDDGEDDEDDKEDEEA